MRVDLYGLMFETVGVTFYLWSPWRSSALEHRLFDAIRQLPQVKFEPSPEELRTTILEAKTVKQAIMAVERIMKGWQEEASDAGGERRVWRWLVEADTDAHGYDHNGEHASLWAFLRLSLERNAPDERDKSEDIDMNGFGMRIWNTEDKA